MYTAISFSIPDPNDNYVDILKTLRGNWGEAFHTGMSRGLLNWGELQKNPKGQVFLFSPINVPDSKLPEFTQRILNLGGTISTNWSAKDINARAVLSYVSEFPHAVSVEKVITSILADSRYNWDGTGREYLLNLIETLITEGRLIKIPDENALTVNPSEESWQANQMFRLHNSLLINIRKNQEEIGKLLDKVRSHWGREDMVYRFYHSSFKVYSVQSMTEEIVAMLRTLDPRPGNLPLNTYFEEILRDGTGKAWKREHNQEWLKHTRPLLEAFFHAVQFLENADDYGEELEEAVSALPSGWANLLYLYDLR